MPPDERGLLSTFLLERAPMREFLTAEQFADLFPHSQRNHPHLRPLYHELQLARALVVDEVERKIAAEVRRGERQRREVVLARRRADRQHQRHQPEPQEHDPHGPDHDEARQARREGEMEIELFGPTADFPTSAPHTLRSVVVEMEHACRDVQAEIEQIDAEADEILNGARATVERLEEWQRGRGAALDALDASKVTQTLEHLRRLREQCLHVAAAGGD
ncbi:MAG: hypothetical protein M1826_007504 [Phylliscum demangeonii]|nr:MAG: hypothetical protein M1826_007504 [Phylliscum demangeonii]